jgi:hypothetical protein
MAGTQQIKEVQPGLCGARAEPGKAVVADLRAKPVLGLMPSAGIVERDPRRCRQSRAQHITRFVAETVVLLGQQPLDLSFGDRHADRL